MTDEMPGKDKIVEVPTEGMGVTILYWSDREPATVIAVSASGKKATIQTDKAIRMDANGMSESQQYRYEPNKDGEVRNIYQVARGKQKGKWRVCEGGPWVILGTRQKYHDYSF